MVSGTALTSWRRSGTILVALARDLAVRATEQVLGRFQGQLHHRFTSVAYARAYRPLPFDPKAFAVKYLRKSAPSKSSAFVRVFKYLRSRRGLAYPGGPSNLPPRGLVGVTGRRILVVHLADRVGPHIEGYLCVGPDSNPVAYNVGVKRLSPEVVARLNLRHNGSGWLTQDSQTRLKKFWASEFQLGKTTFLAQSTDHRIWEAEASWVGRENGPAAGSYGAGELRQVLADDPVVVSTMGKGDAPSVEWHDPLISKHHDAFAFRIMSRTDQNAQPVVANQSSEKLLHGFYTVQTEKPRYISGVLHCLVPSAPGNLRNALSRLPLLDIDPNLNPLSGALTRVNTEVLHNPSSGQNSGQKRPNHSIIAKNRTTNILGVGLKKLPIAPEFQKLKLIFKHDPESLLRAIGSDGVITLKEDGASVKGRSTRHGTEFWSPRVSKVTGQPIRYTWRFRDWRAVTSNTPIEFKGEFLASKNGRQLSSAQIGALLNQDAPISKDIDLQLVIYSTDKIGRHSTQDLSYSEMLPQIQQWSRQQHPDWRAPTIVPSSLSTLQKVCARQEGVVGVKAGGTLATDGYKLKTHDATFDWVLESVDLKPGSKGGIAGVVWFRSLESGRRFKLGGGPLGTHEFQRALMSHPEDYVGRVYAVSCLKQHEGRAAHIQEHSDKGQY